MKILLDTNIILDFALERQPFYGESEQVFLLAQQRQIEGYVSASTFGYLLSSGYSGSGSNNNSTSS